MATKGSTEGPVQKCFKDTNLEANETSELNEFIERVRPYLGNNDDDDLLYAFIVKLKKDEAHERKTGPTGLSAKNFSLEKVEKDAEPYHRVLKPVSTIEALCQEVKDARANGKVLRVVGSEHSPAENIFPNENGITLLLTGELRKIDNLEVKVENGEEVLYCTVGGGCYLGLNPSDPESNEENGLSYVVEAEGFAFGNTGGITHQSIAGYLATGADGGSIKHSFAETVQDIEFVDGCGNVVTAEKDSDVWKAFGVSMGLMGIVTKVTFRLKKTYLVEGVEENVEFADSYLGPDETGKSRLQDSIENIEYFHLNWFPQKYVKRVMQWTGHSKQKPAEIQPYSNTLKNPLAAFAASTTLYTTNRLLNAFPFETTYKTIGYLLRQFTPLSRKQNFCDIWSKTLPSDNQVPVDTIMKVDFTEVWLPLHLCDTVMKRLEKLYDESQEACGNFATEIYCAKKSPFWLSMAYGGDVVRIDPYWFHYNAGDIRKFYSYVWDVLMELEGARCHWGKYLPENGQKCGSITYNLEFLKKSYPMMEAWLEMRNKLDPDQVFVTDYWRKILEIPRNKPEKEM